MVDITKCRSCKGEMTCTVETLFSGTKTEGPPFGLQFGLDGVAIEGVTIHRCPACGDETYELQRYGSLMDTIARALTDKTERLSPQEIRFLRKRLALSSEECAAHLGVDPAIMRGYESIENRTPMERPTERLLRLMVLVALDVSDFHLDRLAIEIPTGARLVLSMKAEKWEARWEAVAPVAA